MNKINLLLLALPMALGACATSFHRGVVAMKLDDNVAHVGLSKGEVSVGDHVQLYGNKCTGSIGGRKGDIGTRKCEKISKGHGVVTEILSDNYVAVKFDDGVAFQEGDVIEKHAH